MVEIHGTGYAEGVYMTDPLPETDTKIWFEPKEVDKSVPAEVGFYGINGKLVFKLDFAGEYEGEEILVEESGKKYKTTFQKSWHTEPTELKEV